VSDYHIGRVGGSSDGLKRENLLAGGCSAGYRRLGKYPQT
jgi:hypothetical protein